MNGERRKHSAADCAWGSAIPEIKTTLEILVEQIKLDNKHRSEVDEKQFNLLYEHTGQIGGLQSDVGHLGKRINSVKGSPAPAAASNCPKPSLWQAICKVKKGWIFFLFIGGGTLIALFGDIFLHIGEWLKQFAATLG